MRKLLHPIAFAWIGVAFATPGLQAQTPVPQDEAATVEKMLDRVRQDMQTIDKLLAKAASSASSKSRAAASSTKSSDLDRALKSSVQASKTVVETIDKLLEHMAKSQGS